jgi:transposase InsO family protein
VLSSDLQVAIASTEHFLVHLHPPDDVLWRGIPEFLRSDSCPEFVAKELRKWLATLGTGTLYIEPGSPWETGYYESFNGKLRDECLNGVIFEAGDVCQKARSNHARKSLIS